MIILIVVIIIIIRLRGIVRDILMSTTGFYTCTLSHTHCIYTGNTHRDELFNHSSCFMQCLPPIAVCDGTVALGLST